MAKQISYHELKNDQVNSMHTYGFTKSRSKSLFINIAYLLTLGYLRLIFHWFPHYLIYATHTKCSLNKATKILIIENHHKNQKLYYVKTVKLISTKNLSSNKYFSLHFPAEKELMKKLENAYLKINLENGTKIKVQEYRAFWFKKQCYIWDPMQYEFSKLATYDQYIYCSDLNNDDDKHVGLSKEEQILRRIVYGNNEIFVPLHSIMKLFFLEMLDFFYVSEILSLAIWIPAGYYFYSIAIIVVLFYGIISSVSEARENQANLREIVMSAEMVKVLRNTGVFERISSVELAPGDIIELPKSQGKIMCDAILLNGSCVVNESTLTGESIPVIKTPLQPRQILYDSKTYSHNTLFCGTTIIQSKNSMKKPVLARVIRTNAQTNKGALVTLIMYPPPIQFEFEQDMYKILIMVFLLTLGGLIYTLIIEYSNGLSLYIWLKALGIFAIGFPPALPAIIILSISYAKSRLKDKGIHCSSTKVINVSGTIDCVCFDKTGTLTEEGVDIIGVIPIENNNFGKLEECSSSLKNYQIFEGMLVCHSLAIINEEIIGNPLDLKMFESTGWTLEEAEVDQLCSWKDQTIRIVKPPDVQFSKENSKINIIQQYQFSSKLRRMSVIAHVREQNQFRIYTKGSPETILNLSRPESRPENIEIVLHKYMERGYRIIAIASKVLQSNKSEVHMLSREIVEKDLEFLGLIVFKNKLKSSTAKVIRELKEANLHMLMATGDNSETAISVARECGIISYRETIIHVTVSSVKDNKNQPNLVFNIEDILLQKKWQFTTTTIKSLEHNLKSNNYKFVLTGETWELLREYYLDLLPKICVKGVVFARMTSDQKQQLVVELMQLGYNVAMCGDGVNDCGALRAAHVGISLSDTEASVASSFTSLIPDISCVPIIIQEGRAALVNSYGLIQFLVCYTTMEFFSTAVLYYLGLGFTDLEYMFIDVGLALNFEVLFGETQAYTEKLVKEPPPTRFLSIAPIFSFIAHTFINTMFLILAVKEVQTQDWYMATIRNEEGYYISYENYAVFCVSIFQYITMAILFSRGRPYRKPIYTNTKFMVALLVMTIMCIYITIGPAQWITSCLQLMMPPSYQCKLKILGIAFVNIIVCFCIEKLLVQWFIEKYMKPEIMKFKTSKKLHREIESDSEFNSNGMINDKNSLLPIRRIKHY